MRHQLGFILALGDSPILEGLASLGHFDLLDFGFGPSPIEDIPAAVILIDVDAADSVGDVLCDVLLVDGLVGVVEVVDEGFAGDGGNLFCALVGPDLFGDAALDSALERLGFLQVVVEPRILLGESLLHNNNNAYQKLSSPILIALFSETAPPMNPLAWTKSMSSIPDNCTNFSMSLIPLHSYFRPLRRSNEPSWAATA